MSNRVALARAIAARTKPRFIKIPRERQRRGLTEAELTERRGGLTAEEYRLMLLRKWGPK